MHVNYIHKNLGTNVILHSDHFRSKRMYFDEVEEVLSMNWELLVDMFTIVAGSDPTIMPNSRHAKRKSQRQMLVSMSEWLMFLKTVPSLLMKILQGEKPPFHSFGLNSR